MKHKILFLIYFFLSTGVVASELCYEFEIKEQGIKSLTFRSGSQKNFYDVNISKGKSNFQSSYYCSKKNNVLFCSGDDDSGTFELNTSEGSLIISNMTLGEPDSETLSIFKTKKILGKKCN